MPASVRLNWFGSLRRDTHALPEPPVDVPLSAPAPLKEILDDLKVPQGLVQLVMVNHRAVPLDTLIHPNDRVALFPREYPFFLDWKDFRA